MSVFVKICGNTNLADAKLAVEYGADALGFIFYPKSKRYVTANTVKQILSQLPDHIIAVGVFVDESQEVIEETLTTVDLDVLQFHGAESPEYCQRFCKPYYKVIHLNHELNYSTIEQDFSDADALLVDTFDATMKGGTGKTFNWKLVPAQRRMPLILAGGLSVDNIKQAIHEVNPYGVDVVSGVEKAPGIKDSIKLQQFISLAKSL